jgi:hypothetical protein
MEKKDACYCGLYCGNCPVKVKVELASKALYQEMENLGFEGIISFFPDGKKFWSFLKGMTTDGLCTSCKAGSGNPACKVRLCAQEKNIEMCALCESYPCDYFAEFFQAYPTLKEDNSFLQEQGWESWAKYQDKRQLQGTGFAYTRKNNS